MPYVWGKVIRPQRTYFVGLKFIKVVCLGQVLACQEKNDYRDTSFKFCLVFGFRNEIWHVYAWGSFTRHWVTLDSRNEILTCL